MASTAGASSSGGIDDNVVGNAGEHVGDGSVRLKKGPWTAEEDAILMEYVRKHGEGNWNAVQRNSGLVRCGKSCRLRWANHLRPNLKKGAFTPQEERLIIELHAKFGNKWARMAALLPGRTDNEIKNYWNTRIKRHQRQGIPLYPPDIQPQTQNQNQTNLQSFHLQYNQHFHSVPPTPTTPTSSFTFQTQQLASPTGSVPPYMNSPNYQQHSPISPHVVANHSFSSHPLYDFSLQNNSGFTFQNQLSSPTTPTNTCGNSPRPPPASPLQSPCTNANSSTPPLFEFPVQRSPPILQAPLRFKRFSSSTPTTPTATNNHNNQTMSLHNAQFQLPFPPLNSASNSTILRHSSTSPCFPELMRSSSDFHEEIQRENEKMCSLFASVTQSELPSNQLLSQTEFDRSVMTNAVGGSSRFGKTRRRICMKRNGVDSRDKGSVFMELMRNGFAEELLLDTKELMSREESPFILPEERPNLLDFDTEFKPDADAADEQNTLTEDLTDFLISIPPSMQAKFYPDSGDISNGQSSVITDDNIGYDMQQMASLIPTITGDHHDKSLETCTWDNLPGIC